MEETKAVALNLSTQRRKALVAAFYPFTATQSLPGETVLGRLE